jgi:hypothetical protein
MHLGFLTTLKRLWTWSLGLMLFTSSPAVKAAERYYLIVFGAQKSINVPKDSHTFGLFVKETDQGSLETMCISWLVAGPSWASTWICISQCSITNLAVVAFPCGDRLKWTVSFMRKQKCAATYWNPAPWVTVP